MKQQVGDAGPEPRGLTAKDPLGLFRQLFAHSLESALLVRPDGACIAANPVASALFGGSESALIAWSRSGDSTLAEVLYSTRAATSEGRQIARRAILTQLRRLDGAAFEAEVASSFFFDERGEPTSIMFIRDLSELRLAERLARESEQRLGFALDAAHIGDWDMDLRTNVARRSLRHDRCFGYRDAVPDWGYDTFLAHVHPLDRNRVDQCFQKAMRLDGDYDVEFRVEWPDASIHWLWSKGRFYFDDHGQPYRVAGIQVDITDRRQAQEQIRRSERDLAITLKSIADAVIATDVAGCVTRMNTAAERLTGWTLSESAGIPLSQVFHAIDAITHELLADPAQQVLHSGNVFELSSRAVLIARGGGERHVSASAAPIRDDEGRIVGIVLVVGDVTESHRARRQLAAATEMLERTSAMAKVGGWELDLVTGQLDWSLETCRIHELHTAVAPPLDQAISYYAPQARPTVQAAIQTAIHHGTPWDLELPLITAKGRSIWVRAQCFPVIEADKVTRLRGAFHDITARKLAEQSLRESKDFSASVIDSLSEQIAVLDRRGVIVAVNEAWRRFALDNGAPASLEGFGVGVDYLGVCEKAVEGSQGDEARKTLAGIRSVLAGEQPSFALEYPCNFPAEVRWYRVSAVPMQGSARGAVVVHTNITERKLTEAALRYSELRYRELFDRNPQPMWVYDLETQAFLAVNAAAVTQYGYSEQEFLRMTLRDIRPPEETSRFDQHMDDFGVGQQSSGRWIHRRKDGGLIQVEIASHGLDYGDRPSRLVLATDVTARELAESEKARLHVELERHRNHLEDLIQSRTIELAAARQQAEQANRAKSAFLANMSHEIRTPLNAIVGLNYLIRRDPVTPAQSMRLDKIDAAGQHLLSIINDVLDLSKIEAGRLQLESTNFHLSAVLDSVHSIIAEAARAKGLTVRVDGNAVPLWLRGDPTRLRQALLNFASNAVKFTENGSIFLSAKLLSEEGEGLLVRFAVEDSGIGIALEQTPRLFQAFEQADASITRKFGGTGLGLAISQRLAALMGGECGFESQPGVGSTFWFTARLQRGRGLAPSDSLGTVPNPETQLRERHRGARILLVEDNEVNLEVALAMLHGVGLDVDTATDGCDAVRLAAAGFYNLILMDMQMPQMGGLEATRLIRVMPGWRTRPILALTANAFDDDRQACSAAGMNDFITKPMAAGRLYEALLRWLGADSTF